MLFTWVVEQEIDVNIDCIAKEIMDKEAGNNLWYKHDYTLMLANGCSVRKVVEEAVSDTLAGYDDDIYYTITCEVENKIVNAVLKKYGTKLKEYQQQIIKELSK